MSYQKIPNLYKIKNRYYWKASGWARLYSEKTSYALGKDENIAITEAIKRNQLLDKSKELEFGTNEYLFEYCKGKIWWLKKSKNRKKVFTNWFYYLGNKNLKNKLFKDCKFSELDNEDVEKFYVSLTNIDYENYTGNNLTSYKEAFDVYKELYDQCINIAFFKNNGLITNPFKFDRIRSGKQKIHATENQLFEVVEYCKKIEEYTIGLAFLITFYWQVREKDILNKMYWFNYKANKYVDLPFTKNHKEILQRKILSSNNMILYPEIEDYINDMPISLKLSKNMITQKRFRKPYSYKTFNRKVREILNVLDLSKVSITFESFRHGGITNLANSGLTESEIKANTKHKNTQSLKPYIHTTHEQEISGQIKRLDKKQSKNK